MPGPASRSSSLPSCRKRAPVSGRQAGRTTFRTADCTVRAARWLPGGECGSGLSPLFPVEARSVIVGAEAAVVRRIIRERAAGTACHVVAAGLQADGVPSPSGMGRWTASRVSGIATNPACWGILRCLKGAREISVPWAIPVISDDPVASRHGTRWRLPCPPG
ncbi:MAG: hypothetical protein EBT09_04260 [Actinobacteria bacterium]|nr:hypothetical protein [Actinomycetota bacterium]